MSKHHKESPKLKDSRSQKYAKTNIPKTNVSQRHHKNILRSRVAYKYFNPS